MLSPVELKKGQSLRLAVDVPKLGPAQIESTVWHVRSVKNPSTRKRAWLAGMVIVKSDETYARLLAPAELYVSVEDDSNDKSEELRMFRVRVQIEGERRTRLLTLGAATEKEAHELALADLDDSWTILEIQRV